MIIKLSLNSGFQADKHLSESEQQQGSIISPPLPSIHVAFDEVYYLERACMTQMLAMAAAGRENLKEMPLDVQEATKLTAVAGDTLDKYAAKHFYAKWNLYKALESDVFQ